MRGRRGNMNKTENVSEKEPCKHERVVELRDAGTYSLYGTYVHWCPDCQKLILKS